MCNDTGIDCRDPAQVNPRSLQLERRADEDRWYMRIWASLWPFHHEGHSQLLE